MKTNFLKLMTAIATTCLLVTGCSKDDDENGTKLNPNPTTVGNIYLAKFTLENDPDGFNMLSEPGFELYPNKSLDFNTLWFIPTTSVATANAYSGSVALHADNVDDGSWKDAFIQSVALKKAKDYVFSGYGRAAWADMGAYFGVRLEGGSICDFKPTWPVGDYGLIEKEFNSGDCVQGNAFSGSWGWPGAWIELDNLKLIPKGTLQTSARPTGASIVGSLSNASYTEITKASQAIVWEGPNNTISMAFANAVIKGTTISNVFARSSDKDLSDGLYISEVNSKSMIDPAGGNEIACITTAGITIGNTQYVHYYSLKEIDATNPNAWTANNSGLLCSTDNGKSWKKETSRWSGSGNFVQVSFYKDSKYIYMFGSPAGRTGVKTYVARVDPEDFAMLSKWTYWNGTEWIQNDPDAATCITYGPSAEMSVTYNAQFKRYIMIYRSITTGCLVYRDAGSPEGEWSGEKVLMYDPNEGNGYVAPSIHPFSTGNDIYFIVSRL